MAVGSVVVKDGNGASVSMGTALDVVNGFQISRIDLDSTQSTYRASANFTPQATAAVTMITVTGSATKTVRIKRILMGGVSTAVSGSILQLVRVSALGAGGTLVAPTVAKLDTASGAATAVVNHWTTTLKATGTGAGGPISTFNMLTGVTVTPATVGIGALQPIFPEVGAAGQSIVLRGTAEILEIQNVTPTNLGAGTVYCYVIEWVEDAS